MQLTTTSRPTSLRSKLSAAACLLLVAGTATKTPADEAPSWQFESSGLIYAEQTRTHVLEPIARISRLFPDGQAFYAQLGIDVVTGASPTGEVPSGQVQTTTTPSGRTVTTQADQVPLTGFSDTRGSLNVGWLKPFGSTFRVSTDAHYSREKDYESRGAGAQFSLDVMDRLTTLTAGIGYNDDSVFPTGGTRAPLSDGAVIINTSSNPKRVTTGLIGLTRILTRQWMVGLTASRTFEDGYLTEPYKVLSVVDATSGVPLRTLTESRPSTRQRSDILVSSVYHLTEDVLYLSYRYYWDDWGLRSHTVDLKYRWELLDDFFVQPHLRFYRQNAADFFRYCFVDGEALPEYASSDYRLGALRTATIGTTIGFAPGDDLGEFTIRAEYIRQWGDGHPGNAVGIQRQFDLSPAVNSGTIVVGYTVRF